MTAILGALVASLSGAILCACASSGAARSSSALLVTLHDFKSGVSFELASESHTERVAYYSGARADAARKVQTDEIMSLFVGEIERQGLARHAQVGRAPALAPGGVISWGLEVECGPETSHWLVGKGSAPADWQEFQKCRDTFLQLYNITVSFQAVQNDSGRGFFGEEPRSAADGKRE
ncbi:MAG: hypothetical protein HOP15_11425 [Planctomycetes bacterium]|nr:hypothetical protein [Planctomycetota bacterium]